MRRIHDMETHKSRSISISRHHLNESERDVSSISNSFHRRDSNISVLSLVDKVHMARDEVFSGPMGESVPSSLTSYAHHAARTGSVASFTFYPEEEPFLLENEHVFDDNGAETQPGVENLIDLESGVNSPMGIPLQISDNDFHMRRASIWTNADYQKYESRVRQKIYITSEDLTIAIVGFQNSVLGYIIYIAICCMSLGLGYLVLRWNPRWKVSLVGNPCSLCDCDWVVIENQWGELLVRNVDSKEYGHSMSTVFGRSEKYQIENHEDDDPIMDNLRSLTYRYMTFLFHPQQDKFVPSNNWKDHRWKDLSSIRLGISGDEIEARESIFGKNLIEIMQKPVLQLLIDEVIHPFYVFQIASLILWTIDSYFYYAGCIFVISLVSIIATLLETLSTMQKLSNISRYECDVRVLRNSFWRYVASSELVPGDVYEVTDPALKQFPCDSILLAGDCIVNESMLTGESVPVSKTPTTLEAIQNLNLGAASIPPEIAIHILFSGTKIIRARRPQEDRHGEAVAIAMVVRTGFNTTKGALVRSMLFPKPSGFKFYRDSFRYIYVMSGIAILGFTASLINFVRLNMKWDFILVRALDLITIVVPPALPATLTIGMNFALSRLNAKSIFCISPQRVNVSGKLDIICFDKTGTLTEDGLDVLGILVASKPEHQFSDLFHEPLSLYSGGHSKESNLEYDPHKTALYAMATCHSLRIVDGQIIGDPLDVKMFEFTGWTFEEGGQRNGYTGDEQGSLSPSVARPPLKKEYSSDYNGKSQSEHPIEIGILKSFEFNSQLRRTSVVVREFGALGCDIYVKGAPECMKDICKSSSFPIDFEDVLAYYTHRGFRVIALASKHITKLSWVKIQKMQRNEAESELDFIGFIIFENKLKPNTEMALYELTQAGIRKMMCTGDNILTAISVARECNLINPRGNCFVPHFIEGNFRDPNARLIWESIDDNSLTLNETTLLPVTISSNLDNSRFQSTSSLQEFSLAITGDVFRWIVDFAPEDILHKMLVYGQVFARMSPDEKNELVEKLQSIDYCCGFCGDGANDCGALKAADVGISLSDAEASVAAPFTSRIFDITCVPIIIREGRAALVTSFCCFKYMSLYSAIQFTTVSFLYASVSNLGDFQFLFIDLALILPIAIFMGWTKAYPTLDRKRPTANLVSRKVLTPLLGQILLSVLYQTIGFLAVREQDWYISPLPGSGDIGNSQNTVLFLLSCYEYILSGIVLSVGPPFRLPWTRNCEVNPLPLLFVYLHTIDAFLLAIIVTLSITTYMLLCPPFMVVNIMQLTKMSWSFKFFMLVLGLSYVVTASLSEKFLWNRLARYLGNIKNFRKQKKQKIHKVISDNMYSI